HLNKACQIALERVHSPRYRQLNAILTNPVNKSLFNSMELEAPVTRMGYVRGSDYYGGKQHD
ncbi:IS21 family transposase, partial [Fundicoccus sp. Sow4_D5]